MPWLAFLAKRAYCVQNMKDFKHNNKFGGGNRGGDRAPFGGGNHFGKKPWDGPKEMHKAVCAKCQKSCEVPFRPSGDRPVYCHDCFDKTKSNTPIGGSFSRNEGNTFPKRELVQYHGGHGAGFTAPSAPRQDGNGSNKQMDEIKHQLDVVTAKLDRLLQKIEGSSKKETAPTPTKESLKEVVASVVDVPKKATSLKTKKGIAKKTVSKKR